MPDVAVLLFEGITALDAVGPYEILQRLPGYEVKHVARAPGALRTDNKSLALVADYALDEVPEPEIVVVPGGFGSDQEMHEAETLDWVRRVHQTSRFTTSVCTGSFILASAGVLKGLRATTHWARLEDLRPFGVDPTSERVVEQGKVITAAGVSSGIDMALRLAQLVAGDDVAQGIQLSVEYDPQPPFDAGSTEKAPAHVLALVKQAIAERNRQRS